MAITHYNTRRDANGELVLDRSSPKVTHIGRVLRVYKADYRAMSDVYTYATFADVATEDGRVVQVMVNANFECDVSGGHAEVDADDFALSVQDKVTAERKRLEDERYEKMLKERQEREANTPVKGKRMVVKCSRGVAKEHDGKVGVVFYINFDRVGLDVTGRKDARGYAIDPIWVNAKFLRHAPIGHLRDELES